MIAFLKKVLFIIASSCLLVTFFEVFYSDNGILFTYLAIPASVISSTLFLVFDYLFMKGKVASKKLYMVRLSYWIGLFIMVVAIMMNGKDVFYYFFPLD